MAEAGFSVLDWLIVLIYLIVLLWIGHHFSKHPNGGARSYFLGDHKMSFGVVAISVLATTQSAATFLGGPDQGYSGNFTYVSSNIGAFIATAFVIFVLLPRFYALKVTTVYNLIEDRISSGAMRAAGSVYLVGRIFASGARLYLAAIAVSMILFANVDVQSIFISALLITVLGFSATFMGGIRSVIWSDLAQFVIYISAAIVALYTLITQLGVDYSVILSALENAPVDASTPELVQNKLIFFDLSTDLSKPFTLLSIVLGITLLLIGNYGLDQDTTQRLLTCKNAKESSKALFLSAIIAVPVGFLFVAIGQLLYLFYQRPDLMSPHAANEINQMFDGERITVFMFYILNEMPSGLRGLMTIGVVSASISTLNSGINSMASVVVHDFYQPLIAAKKHEGASDTLIASRLASTLVAIVLLAMSMLCFYWQRYTNMPLLDFALSVMVFAYSGLLGVFFTLLFTQRGSAPSVYCALATGFIISVIQQSYVIDLIGLPVSLGAAAFTWKLCLGTLAAFIVCAVGRPSNATPKSTLNPQS